MTLTVGTILGPYEVVGKVGEGGMGEVFRARDTRLHRDVAIKILPETFAADADRRARFEREAQTLAALNHPNIAHIYGVLEEPAALVMELAEGEDLAERIARAGRLPIDEALTIARQIAAALDAAHDRGIVHRDLKPSNVRIGPDNAVKVLDFGLALETARTSASRDTANSPTFTSPALLTRAGMILGTAAYMAPEQARGQVVDRRADIWAFGCVLYEMLTGRRAFEGESIADVLHAILGSEPDWTALPDATPGRVREVLGWCLRRDPAERLKDAGDLRVLLGAIDDPPRAKGATTGRPRWRMVASLLGWTTAAALAGVLLWARSHPPPAASRNVMHVDVPLTPALDAENQQFASSFAVAPDGSRLVYVGHQGSSTALFLQDLSTGESRLLPDTADAYAPFFSPDGSAVGFVAGDRIRTVSLTGRLGRDLVEAPLSGNARLTADWDSGGVVFTDLQGVRRIPATGGTPSQVAELLTSEAGFFTPRALPDGHHLLVAVRKKSATKTDDPSEIAVVDPATNAHRVIVEQGGSPALLRSDGGDAFLVYARTGRLWAARFNLSRLALDGAAQPVVDNVEMRPNGDGAQFAVSATGTLVYLEASPTELVWVDRTGDAKPASAVTRRYAMPRVAPGGRSIAVEVQAVPHQLSLLQPDRDLISPLTQWKEGSHDFAWSPDGRALAFTASVGDGTSVMWMPVDGSQDPIPLIETNSDGEPWVNGWSRDGRRLAVIRRGTNSSVLQIVSVEPGTPPRVAGAPVTIATGGLILSADFSPDGEWVAWCGSASGRAESNVYIARASGGPRYEIDAGSEPRWDPTGHVLYYRNGRDMMAVDVAGGADPGVGRPRKLFDGPFLQWGTADYDVARDGRLLMVRPAASAMGRLLKVRLNWDDELKKLF